MGQQSDNYDKQRSESRLQENTRIQSANELVEGYWLLHLQYLPTEIQHSDSVDSMVQAEPWRVLWLWLKE